MGFIRMIKGISWNLKLKVIRDIYGWSQEKAAERCGTTKKVYWLWENGKNYPRKNSRRAIAAAFKVPEEEIFDRKV